MLGICREKCNKSFYYARIDLQLIVMQQNSTSRVTVAIKKRRTLTLIYFPQKEVHIYSHRMVPPTLRALTLNILRIYAWQVIIMYNHRVMIDRFHRDQEFLLL